MERRTLRAFIPQGIYTSGHLYLRAFIPQTFIHQGIYTSGHLYLRTFIPVYLAIWPAPGHVCLSFYPAVKKKYNSHWKKHCSDVVTTRLDWSGAIHFRPMRLHALHFLRLLFKSTQLTPDDLRFCLQWYWAESKRWEKRKSRFLQC